MTGKTWGPKFGPFGPKSVLGLGTIGMHTTKTCLILSFLVSSISFALFSASPPFLFLLTFFHFSSFSVAEFICSSPSTVSFSYVLPSTTCSCSFLPCICFVSFWAYSAFLKMETVLSFETSIIFYRSKWRHIPPPQMQIVKLNLLACDLIIVCGIVIRGPGFDFQRYQIF